MRPRRGATSSWQASQGGFCIERAHKTPYHREMPLKYLIPLLAVGMIAFVLLFIFARRFAITLIFIAVGFSMVARTSWILGIFGRVPWAEEHLTGGFGAGLGGSWAWYKLLGVAIIVGALLYFTGLLQIILVNVLGPFFGGAENF